MTAQPIRTFRTSHKPIRYYKYRTSTPDDLKGYPCCFDATVTTGLRTLIQDDQLFAFQKLQDGLALRRRQLMKKNLPVGEYTIAELLRAGFILDTVPLKPTALRTVERRRKQASTFCTVFGKLQLKQFTEDFLWMFHAVCATGCSDFNNAHIKVEMKDAKALRRGIHDFVKHHSSTPVWILRTYNWDWQSHPTFNRRPKSTRMLKAYLLKRPNHPKFKDYLPFFGAHHV